MVTTSLADYRHETTRQATRPEKAQAKAQTIREHTTRGLLTLNGGKVHHLEGNLWAVPSSRGGFHELDLEHETCDCEDFAFYGRYHGVVCRHIYVSAIANASRRGGVRSAPPHTLSTPAVAHALCSARRVAPIGSASEPPSIGRSGEQRPFS